MNQPGVELGIFQSSANKWQCYHYTTGPCLGLQLQSIYCIAAGCSEGNHTMDYPVLAGCGLTSLDAAKILAFLHPYCIYCSSLITLYTFLRYLGSLSCAHYLIPNITNAPLILFLCSSSLVSALSCRCVWLSLSLPTLVEPCSCLVTKLATRQSLIQFVISLAFNPLTP